jgi:hypothetical protein
MYLLQRLGQYKFNYSQSVVTHSNWVCCIKDVDIGYLKTPCNLSFLDVVIFVMNLHNKLSIPKNLIWITFLMHSSMNYKFTWKVKSWKCLYLLVFFARFWYEKVHQMLAIMLDPKFKKCAFSHNICKLWKCIKFGCWLLLTIVIAFVIGNFFQITYANYVKSISRIYFTSVKTYSNTLKSLVLKKFNKFHHNPIDVDCKCLLN